jgi:NADPH2:quinone reductase
VGPGEIVVRVGAASVNFPDVLMVAGGYQHKPELPFVPGMEGAGTIHAVGADVTNWKPGDRVIFGVRPGAFAEYVKLKAGGNLMRLPEGWSFAEGSGFRVAAQTAYHSLVHRAALKKGEVLLVHGASGGVGLAAVQLGRHLGARVIATGSDDGRLAVVRENGADEVVNYRTGDFVAAVKEMTNGKGCDVIYDPVGGDIFDQVKRCVAWAGRIVIIGFAGGRIPSIECNRILLKNMAVVGLAWGQYLDRGSRLPEEAQFKFYDMLERRQIDPVIYRSLPFADVKEGLRLIESREVYGKVVITR